MLSSRATSHDSLTNVSVGSRIYIKNAGGSYGRFVLVVEYAPRKGQKKMVRSNHLRYGKSWAAREEISEEDKQAFIQWVSHELAIDGVGGSRQRRLSTTLPSRSSSRSDGALTAVRTCVADMVVEQSVLHCVKFLIHSVVQQARLGIDGLRTNFVPAKPRQYKTNVAACKPPSSARSWHMGVMTKRMRAAARLTQRKRKSRGFNYRSGVLLRLAAARAEADQLWLNAQQERLATIVARQHLYELLPDGARLLSTSYFAPT